MWPNICRPEWELNCSQHLDLGCFVRVPGHQAKGNGPLLAPDPVAFWAMDSPVRKHGDIAAAETASVQARQGRRLNPTRRGHDNNARPLRMALFTFLFHIATSLGRLVSAATISSFRKPSRLLRFHLFKQMLREAATGRSAQSCRPRQNNSGPGGPANSSPALLRSASWPMAHTTFVCLPYVPLGPRFVTTSHDDILWVRTGYLPELPSAQLCRCLRKHAC